MRIAILGNSGSGKSTLARWLVERHATALLDLDTVAWEPQQIAVARDHGSACADIAGFCRSHASWVIEGCYAGLLESCFIFRPTLIFLNPGAEVCLAQCRERPWEPHKYPSKQQQDARLEFLLSWVREYYVRDGDLSLAGHRACFERYAGPKVEFVGSVSLEPPDPKLVDCIEWTRKTAASERAP